MLTSDTNPPSIDANAPVPYTDPKIFIRPSIASPIFPETFAARNLPTGALILIDEVLLDGISYLDRNYFLYRYNKLSEDEKQFFAMLSPTGNRNL